MIEDKHDILGAANPKTSVENSLEIATGSFSFKLSGERSLVLQVFAIFVIALILLVLVALSSGSTSLSLHSFGVLMDGLISGLVKVDT